MTEDEAADLMRSAARGGSRRAILVVDDEIEFRDQLCALIQRLGHRTVTAEDGEAAWKRIEAEGDRLDLVISDLRMPGIGGIELLRRIRHHRANLPVVIISGYSDFESCVHALRNNAFDFLNKPFSGEQIRAVLRRAEAAWERGYAELCIPESDCAEDLRLTLPTRIEMSRRVARHLRDHYSRVAGGTRIDLTNLMLCLMEAIENAIIHGSLGVGPAARERGFDQYEREIRTRLLDPQRAARRIRVEGHLDQDWLRISVLDEGDGFDYQNLPKPADPAALLTGGRGIFIIRSFMDEVSWSDDGRAIHMGKRLQPLN